MECSLKPDYEQTLARYDAFWNRAVIDRPLVSLAVPRRDNVRGVILSDPRPVPQSLRSSLPADAPKALRIDYETNEARWLDIDARAERLAWQMEQYEYLGDSLPIAWPNMGPEIFSAWCGAGYSFGESTTWSSPSIHDWSTDGPRARFDDRHPLFLATMALTEKLIERGRDRFIVGLTDFHPGGDHVAALRDPQTLAIDLIDHPNDVKKTLVTAAADYARAYDLFYDKIRAAGMPSTSWLDLVAADGKYYIPSNDFSGMISTEMFAEFFLPGIIEECRFLDRSIYHVDGPGALRHLDLLLDIPELDAIQWVPGAGNEDLPRWIPTYQKIQAAGKGVQILDVSLGNLQVIIDNLRPEGVYIPYIRGVDDRETAEEVLRRLARWT